jgi:hypothetical protein
MMTNHGRSPVDVAVTLAAGIPYGGGQASIAELGDVGYLNMDEGESLQSKLVVIQCLSYGHCNEAREDMRGLGRRERPR